MLTLLGRTQKARESRIQAERRQGRGARMSMISPDEGAARGKTASIVLLALCQVAALALWFSATAVTPSILRSYPLTPTQVSLFTSMVQVGFVAGTLASATLGLADRLDPRRFFMMSALVAAAANASMLFVETGGALVYIARFITVACVAG